MRLRPVWLACLLLTIAASRIIHFDVWTQLTVDELWAVYRTSGTVAQTIAWTPYDWPTGSYLIMGAWQDVTGSHPATMRLLPLLAFLLGISAFYRVMYTRAGDGVALLATLLFAAFGKIIYGSVMLRGHSLTLAAVPFVLWLTLAYFERPRLWRGVVLGAALAALLYIHLTNVIMFVAVGVFTLVLYGRRVWRWWLPGVVMLALGSLEIRDKLLLSLRRVESTINDPSPPLLEAWAAVYGNLLARFYVVWAALAILALLLLIFRQRNDRRWVFAWGAWATMPVFVYATDPLLDFFSARYILWALYASAVVMAYGLAHLPRTGLVVGALLVMMLWPTAPNRGEAIGAPVGEAVGVIAAHASWGDVLMLDPEWEGALCGSACKGQEHWIYYMGLFYREPMPVVDDPAGHRRVWYAYDPDDFDLDALNGVWAGRVEQLAVDFPDLALRYFEAPPNPTGVLFENGLRFHGYDLLTDYGAEQAAYPQRREGEVVRVRLWWSVDEPLDLDYSVRLEMTTDAETLDSIDGPPVAEIPETSRWEPGEYYIEERVLTMPTGLGPQVIDVALTMVVYQWWDGVRIAAPGVDENIALPLTTISLRAW